MLPPTTPAPASEAFDATAPDQAPIHPEAEASSAAEVPNPALDHEEQSRHVAERREEADTGRHAIDRSRPSSFVHKTH